MGGKDSGALDQGYDWSPRLPPPLDSIFIPVLWHPPWHVWPQLSAEEEASLAEPSVTWATLRVEGNS